MLRTLIIEAFGIRGIQIEHPAWVAEERFDIVANVPRGATKEQARIMMRNLLVARFQLQIRREMKAMDVYALVIAKDGVKMKPSGETTSPETPAPTVGSFDLDRLKTGRDGFPQVPPNAQGILTAYVEGKGQKAAGQKQSLSKIATFLTAIMDRPVIDLTGLSGDYDLSFVWSPDSDASNGEVGPDILTAVQQQLGLKLEPRKMPFEKLIVVSALKAPIEN